MPVAMACVYAMAVLQGGMLYSRAGQEATGAGPDIDMDALARTVGLGLGAARHGGGGIPAGGIRRPWEEGKATDANPPRERLEALQETSQPPRPTPTRYPPLSNTTKPSILMLIADDLRYDFMGASHVRGGPQLTPHIDTIAAEGAVFENVRVQGR